MSDCTTGIVSLIIALVFPMSGFEGVLLRKQYPLAFKISLFKWVLFFVTLFALAYILRDVKFDGEDFDSVRDQVKRIFKNNGAVYFLYMTWLLVYLIGLYYPLKTIMTHC